MCGIAGVFNYRDGSPVVQTEIRTMLNRMRARGPDGEGEWNSIRKDVAFGHRRLAIIDLSANGAQPMRTHDGTLTITFNGEIYNYRALRSELESTGVVFRSSSDTEVLLHLYAREGPKMVERLRGMFAFALWDEPKRGLFICRDHLGIKPLYYSDNGCTFRVASQIKALLATGVVDTTPDPAGQVGFFVWGHVPEPFTLYRGIRSVPAGTSCWIDSKGPRKLHCFFNLSDIFASAEQNKVASAPCIKTANAAQEYLRNRLLDTVRHHLIADVPVGVFLSAGMDSGSLAAATAEIGADLRTVTLGFHEFKGLPVDETNVAEQMAAKLGARHKTVWITRSDFVAQYAKLMDAMDSPTIDGINSYFISWAAKEAGLKVVLSGVGGDELFGGYSSFRDIPRIVRWLAPFNSNIGRPVGRLARRLAAPVLSRFTSPKYASLLEYGGNYSTAYLLHRALFLPWELHEIFDPDIAQRGWEELGLESELRRTLSDITMPRLKVCSLEMQWYLRNQLLRDTDWASMAHSVEVRTPFVDIELVRGIADLVVGYDGQLGKLQLAGAVKPPLPDFVTSRPKTGFSVPLRQWLGRHDESLDSKTRNLVFTLAADPTAHRGLRGWSKSIYDSSLPEMVLRGRRDDGVHSRTAASVRSAQADNVAPRSLRILVLATDAFGGNGGIAKFNRDFLRALATASQVASVVAIPRLAGKIDEDIPTKILFDVSGANNKVKFAAAVIRQCFSPRMRRGYDLVICGHVNLLPAAFPVARLNAAPVILILHGIEAWKPHGLGFGSGLAKRADHIIAVSEITRDRFLAWSEHSRAKSHILPNCIDLDVFTPGPKKYELLDRYQLHKRKIILTLGRLAAEERYKGFDEVLDVLADIRKEVPALSYLIVGDGSDRKRLEEKVRNLGLSDHVIFTGRIPENEKVDHYRLADSYIMVSRGEGFGIVFLEAMACGIPVVGSKVDGGREALRNGELGLLVDPNNPAEIKSAILEALQRPITRPSDLEYFSVESFHNRVHELINVCYKS